MKPLSVMPSTTSRGTAWSLRTALRWAEAAVAGVSLSLKATNPQGHEAGRDGRCDSGDRRGLQGAEAVT